MIAEAASASQLVFQVQQCDNETPGFALFRHWRTCSGLLCMQFSLTFAIHDATAFQVVRGDFHDNTITRHDSDEVLSHFPGNVSHHLVAVFKLHAKLSIRECFDHVTFDLN